jgi:putative flippase GtrA
VQVPDDNGSDDGMELVAGRRRAAIRLRGEGWLAQLTRFALVGGSSNVLYALAFLSLRADGTLAANIIGVVVSTMLANELHRRLTFHAADRVHWFDAQWEGGALAVLGLVLSSVVIALMHVFRPSAGGLTQALLVIAVSALAGGVRFIFLRGWVFAPTVAPDYRAE